MDTTKLESVIASLQEIVQDGKLRDEIVGDAKLRDRLSEACRHAMLRLDRPWDFMHRSMFGVHSLSVAKAGIELGLWKALTDASPNAVHVDELAKSTGGAGPLLTRLLRYAVAHGMAEQTDAQSFRAIAATESLSMPFMDQSLNVAQGFIYPSGLQLTNNLTSLSKTEPADQNNTAFNRAFGTENTLFQWMSSNPKMAQGFNAFMTFKKAGLRNDWLDHFPFSKYVDVNDTTDRMQFVDVGGGNGHQALGVLQRYPQLAGKVVLQDLPTMGALEKLKENQRGLAPMACDFFQPNPLQGAKAYYLRDVLHDWTDENCRIILGHLRDALAEDSVIMVDDLVIANMETHWYPSTIDITMMTVLAAKERSLMEWSTLIESVGLERKDVVHYESYGLAVQVLGKKRG